METKPGLSSWTRFMVVSACFVVLVAGMRVAAPILVPFLLSVFIVIICTPFLFWLQKKGVPDALAVLSILVGVIVLFLILAAMVGASLNDFTRALPEYQRRLAGETAGLIAWLKNYNIEISSQMVSDFFDPAKVWSGLSRARASLRGRPEASSMIKTTVSSIRKPLARAPLNPESSWAVRRITLAGFSQFTESVNRYIGIKTIFSLVTGIFIWLWLVILGVNHPILWGLLAFLLNYVPNIGSIIAAVPAVLLALVQLGLPSALLTATGYVVVNVVVGSIIEPRFMGKGLGLSTLVVFLSLVFWGWALGMVGMVLSVPLTMIFKIALESSSETRWIAVLLGSPSPDSLKTE